LDEANPVLDTDLIFGNVRARVAAIQQPLSPYGLGYAIRRHREEPWTLPLFINRKMLNSFSAGLLSFLVDGNRTLLVAGTRSSGKTSLLGSLMLEIIPKFRVIVVEDTLELPVDSLRKLGYDILRMKVRSALVAGTTEVEASEGIRTSLRLGDSALIVGEVRSNEARALYEAMRVGALANVVAGTIHGESPYGVFDRVVNDLNVPTTSFKATDVILVANPVKTPDGLHSMKRIVGLTEVRKHWTHDPAAEAGFVDLLRYNVEKDEIEPTPELINGESVIIKNVAGNVKGWAGNWDAVYDNILLRGKIKQEIVDIATRLGKPELMEAKFNALSNTIFHKISDDIRGEIGIPSSERVFPEWKKWALDAMKSF
jgi:type IV secretory pathway ATPase VirB11/archaellum biosynthesis ATPase